MSLTQIASGEFTWPGGTSDYKVRGLGFTPKMVMVFDRGLDTGVGSFINAGQIGIGFKRVPGVGSATVFDRHASFNRSIFSAQNFGNAGLRPEIISDIRSLVNGTNSSSVLLGVVSIDFDGFTLDYSFVTLNARYQYIAFGGDDFDCAFIHPSGPVGTGTQSVTGAGFQPTLALFLSTTATATGFGVGWFDGTRSGCSAIAERNNANPSQSRRYQRSNRCIGMIDPVAGTVVGEAAGVQFTADGVDLTWSVAPGAALDYSVVLMKGVAGYAGTLLQPSAVGNQVKSCPGVAPKVVLFSSVSKAAMTSTADVATDIRMMFGFADLQRSVSVNQMDNNGTAAYANNLACRYGHDTACVIATTPLTFDTGTLALTGTVDAAAYLKRLNARGSFTLTWTAVGGPANFETLFLAIGPAADDEVVFNDGGESDIGLTWVEITDKLDTLRVHSKVGLSDPASYYGGYKDDRIVQWGNLTRALSDRAGQYEAPEFVWIQSDTDHLYRGLGAAEATRTLKNRPATVRMIDDPSRRLLQTPRTMMRGLVRQYKPVAPLLWEWRIRDPLASKFASENEKAQLPLRLISRADFPDCPVDAINLPVPIIYGSILDDASTADPPILTGTPAIGAFVLDGVWNAGFTASSSAAAIPAGVVVGLAAGGTLSTEVPNGEYAVLVTAVDSSGVESDPHVFYTDGASSGRGTFADGPLASYAVSPDGTQKIQVSWSASAGAAKYRAYLCVYYYGARYLQMIEVTAPTVSCEFTAGGAYADQPTIDNITPTATLIPFTQFWYYAVAAEMSDGDTALSTIAFGKSHPYRRGLRVEWLTVAGAAAYKVYRRGSVGTYDRVWTVPTSQTYFDDDLLDTGVSYVDGAPQATGQVPVTFVGMRNDLTGQPWFAFLVCGHAVSAIVDVFQGAVRVDPGTFGVTFAVPGETGFSTYFSDSGDVQYRDINSNRYTLIYARGPQGQAAADGTSPITLNVDGIETAGDGSGTLITDILEQYRHAWKNWMVDTYTSGDWLAPPTFGDNDSLSQVDEESFILARNIARARYAGGYVGAWMLGAKGERISLRDLVARLNLSADVDSGFNRRTQFFVSIVDDRQQALDTAPDIVAMTDVLKESCNLEPVDDEHFNVVPYSYGQDYVGLRAAGWAGITETQDDDEIAQLDGEEKRSPTVGFYMVRSAGQALDVASRRLQRTKMPPIRITFQMNMAGLSHELGDLVRLTHFEGLGTDGYARVPARIVRHDVNPDTFTVTLELREMTRVFGATFTLGEEATLPSSWTAATEAQQTYGYLASDTTGAFSDGAIGKRLR